MALDILTGYYEDGNSGWSARFLEHCDCCWQMTYTSDYCEDRGAENCRLPLASLASANADSFLVWEPNPEAGNACLCVVRAGE